MMDKVIDYLKRIKEDDIPIVKIGDDYITPLEMIEQDLPKEIINTSSIDWDLLSLRIEEKYKKGRIEDRYTTNGLITAEEIMENVRDRTDDGFRYMMMEHGIIRDLIERVMKDV